MLAIDAVENISKDKKSEQEKAKTSYTYIENLFIGVFY